MIKEKQALSMKEADDLLGSLRETDKIKDTRIFIKKFCKTDAGRCKKLKEALVKLELLKLKQTDIAKIIDILPEDAAELNKITTEVSLDADETNKILETIKNTK